MCVMTKVTLEVVHEESIKMHEDRGERMIRSMRFIFSTF